MALSHVALYAWIASSDRFPLIIFYAPLHPLVCFCAFGLCLCFLCSCSTVVIFLLLVLTLLNPAQKTKIDQQFILMLLTVQKFLVCWSHCFSNAFSIVPYGHLRFFQTTLLAFEHALKYRYDSIECFTID